MDLPGRGRGSKRGEVPIGLEIPSPRRGEENERGCPRVARGPGRPRFTRGYTPSPRWGGEPAAVRLRLLLGGCFRNPELRAGSPCHRVWRQFLWPAVAGFSHGCNGFRDAQSPIAPLVATPPRPNGAKACSHGSSPRCAGATGGNVRPLPDLPRRGRGTTRGEVPIRLGIPSPRRGEEKERGRYFVHGFREAQGGLAPPVATPRRPVGAGNRPRCISAYLLR